MGPFLMPILVIGVPLSKAPPGLDTVLKSKMGLAYCLTSNEVDEIRPGWHVIVLDKDTHRRADGTLLRLEPVAPDPRFPCARGRTRYNVYMNDELARVSYEVPLPTLSFPPKLKRDGSPWLNHAGVAVLL